MTFSDLFFPVRDVTADVPAAGCSCSKAAHEALELAASRPESLHISNRDMRLPRPARKALHDAGLAEAQEARESGWDRGMWMLYISPAGLAHIAAVLGDPDAHLGCTGHFTALGGCDVCGETRRLTVDQAIARLVAIAADPDSIFDLAQETWATSFSCETHGRGTVRLVTTKKTCSICGRGLIRHMVPVTDRD